MTISQTAPDVACGYEELARFCELLQALLSDNNAFRKESERIYQSTKQSDPDRLCRCLLTVLTQAPNDILRQQSAVLLRQCLKSSRVDFVWPLVPLETQEAIKTQLVVALKGEPVRLTRHKVCDAVSMLACHVLDPSAMPGGWPAIGPVLSELVEAQDSNHRESALRIIKEMLGVNPPVVQSLVNDKLARIIQVCHSDASLDVRKESVLLFAAVLEHLPQSEWEPLRCFMPRTLEIIQQFVNSEEHLQECLEALVQVVDWSPAAFQQHLDVLVPMMLAISRARDQCSDGIRKIAFEFLVSMCEKKTKLCSRIPNYITDVVNLCMEFMLEIEDEDNWAQLSDQWSMDVSNYDVGEENIDRFAQALGAEVVLEPTFNNVKQFVNHSNWKYKYVAVMTLSQCAETVRDESHVDEIVNLLVALLTDEHPRVRYAALHAIGQTSTDHSPYLQETHCELVLPALSRLMSDPVVRVASHACAAFVNFAEDLDRESLLPYVPGLMEKLGVRMISQALVAKEQAITAIAVIAGVIEAEFVQYYHTVVPVLKQIVLTADKKEERGLRGKAFECMSLMGLAVGRSVFQQDAQEAMQAMMDIASRGLDADDPQKSYILEAAQRICRALKEHFLPYLGYLLPGIYATLQMQPVVVLDPEAEDLEEDMTTDFLQDGTSVGLKTSQIEDFQGGVQMLACFLEVLGGHYFDHVRDTARALLPALSFRFSDDVRREATLTWQELIGAAKAGLQMRQAPDDGIVADLLRGFLEGTLESMRVEEDVDILQVQAIGTTACIKSAGPGTMTLSEVQAFCVRIRSFIEESTQRQWEYGGDLSAGQGMDEDEMAAAEQQRDADQMLRIKYAELVGAVMEVHRNHFLEGGLQQFLPIMQECIKPGRSPADRCLALYLADDVLEKLGKDGVAVWPAFMGQIMESISDPDVWVRQAAAYGVIHAAPIADFAPFADRAAASIGNVLSDSQIHLPGNKEAREAAVAALGALCRCQGAQINAVNRYLLLFLHGLPIIEDVDQAGPAHEILMAYVQEGNLLFQEHVSKVCHVFLEVYGRDTSSDALNAGIQRVFVHAGEERLKQMQPPFSLKQKKRIEKILRDAKKQG